MVEVELLWEGQPSPIFAPGSTHTATAKVTSRADREYYFFAQLIFAGSAPNLGPMDLLLQPGQTVELSKAVKMPNVEGEYPCQILVVVWWPPPEPFYQDFYIDAGVVTIEGAPEVKFSLWWLVPIPLALIGAAVIAKRRKR